MDELIPFCFTYYVIRNWFSDSTIAEKIEPVNLKGSASKDKWGPLPSSLKKYILKNKMWKKLAQVQLLVVSRYLIRQYLQKEINSKFLKLFFKTSNDSKNHSQKWKQNTNDYKTKNIWLNQFPSNKLPHLLLNHPCCSLKGSDGRIMSTSRLKDTANETLALFLFLFDTTGMHSL